MQLPVRPESRRKTWETDRRGDHAGRSPRDSRSGLRRVQEVCLRSQDRRDHETPRRNTGSEGRSAVMRQVFQEQARVRGTHPDEPCGLQEICRLQGARDIAASRGFGLTGPEDRQEVREPGHAGQAQGTHDGEDRHDEADDMTVDGVNWMRRVA